MDEKKRKRLPGDFAWQEYDREEFEETFPALARELEGWGLPVGAYRSSEGESEEDEEARNFSGYTPTVIDFLRRCETDDEALEVINWMEEHGDISHKMAKRLRVILIHEGVRAFGPKKGWGWYERHRG